MSCKSDPSSTTTTNENSHIVEVHQRVGHSNSLPKFAPQQQPFLSKVFFQMVLEKFFFAVVYLLVACVSSFVLGLCFVTLIYSCILTVSLAILPLLLVSLIITRIFQIVKCGGDYKNLTEFKYFLRGWLYIDVIIVIVGLWIFHPIAKFVPSLKPILVLDLHLTDWVMIITIVCAFYLISFVMYNFTHDLTRISNVGNINIPQAISEIIDAFIFWWAKYEVMKRVPTFQHHEILGLPTRKWLRVSILLLIGYNVITLFTHLLVISLRCICNRWSSDSNGGIGQKLLGKQLHTKYVVHFANGMRLSISFVMSSLLFLLTWIFYFGARLDMNVSGVQSIWELGKWTFTCLFIYSFLWLIKSFILLAWEVSTVYVRLESKIKSISQDLYFLGNLSSDKNEFFKLHPNPKRNEQEHDQVKSSFAKWVHSVSREFTFAGYLEPDKLIVQKRERVKSDLLLIGKYPSPSMDDLRRAAHWFVSAQKYLRKKKYMTQIQSIFETYNEINLETWMELNRGHNDKCNLVEYFKKMFTFHLIFQDTVEQKPEARSKGSNDKHNPKQKSEAPSEAQNNGELINDWNCFANLLSIKSEESISTTDLETWVERAHIKCMFLSNTLSSAQKVGSSLNKIISWLLLGATFIMWLLLSGLATTQVLVLIASPFLAATFIFGESCKTMFQGILFVYVIHPFDVGDFCVIEDKTVVVTAIDIWTTTFSEAGAQSTQRVVIYPNIQLATKVILNYKTKFDWSDCLDFILGDAEKTYLTHNALIQHFRSRINDRKKDLSLRPPITLTILTKGDSVSLVIRLKYKAKTTKGCTYSLKFEEKDRLRAEFYRVMKEIIRNFKYQYGLD